MTDTLTLALDLVIESGFHVFPVSATSATPLLPHGHLEASDDVEAVATWFGGEFVGARIGVATGASGIVVGDLDRKNGKDGFQSVEDEWLELPPTFSYPTPNGGEHRLYAAPAGVPLNGQADYRGLTGFDRRGGSSYIVFHGARAPRRDDLAEAPSWLLDPAVPRSSEGWGKSVAEWLAEFGTGEPTSRMQAAISRIPASDFSHSTMVEQQYNIIRLGAEGELGAEVALGVLRQAWLSRPPAAHTTPQDEWPHKFEEAFESGVLKYGEAVAEVRALPPYIDALDALPPEFDLSVLTGAPGEKRDWFTALDRLAPLPLAPEQVAALLWSGPRVSRWSREFGLPYLLEQLAVRRAKAAEPVERPEPLAPALTGLDLLTEAEREVRALCPTFVDRYMAWVASRVRHFNPPYHRAAAHDVLSLSFGMYGFLAEDEGTLGINLYQGVLGPSSTGKTRAQKLRKLVLDEVFGDDQTFNLGFDPSLQGMQRNLLKRDNRASALLLDEADTSLGMWLGEKYLGGMIGFLTMVYEGWVPAQLRTSSADDDASGATVSFNISLWGTPRKVTDLLTDDLFDSGFLPRFVWFLGEPPRDDDSQDDVSTGDRKRAMAEYDEGARAFATEFLLAKRLLGRRKPLVESEEALQRLREAKRQIRLSLRDYPRADVLRPAATRLGDTIRKVAALYALADGRDTVLLPDMLAAVEQGSEWLRNLFWFSEQIAASSFQRECDEVERAVASNGGVMTLAALTNRFKRWTLRDFQDRLNSLESQHRLKYDQTRTRVLVVQDMEE